MKNSFFLFNPVIGRFISPDGEIRDEDKNSFDDMKTIYVTHDQYKKMKKVRDNKKKNTTGYKLIFDDCVEHTSDLIKAGGIDAPSDVTNPRPITFFNKL